MIRINDLVLVGSLLKATTYTFWIPMSLVENIFANNMLANVSYLSASPRLETWGHSWDILYMR